MAIIGTFTKSENGFAGSIRTLAFISKARISSENKTKDAAPDYRVYAGPAEIGVAWKKTSEAGRAYLSLKLDDPSFPAPIYASLVESEAEPETYALIWSRRTAN